MTILFDGWLPDGNANAKLESHAYVNILGSLGVSPVVQTPPSLSIQPSPLLASQSVAYTSFRHTDTHFADGSVRTMLLPITPTNADPIIDWGAPYVNTRRWYRFAFLTTGWPREAQTLQSSRLTVVWQLHDQADTGEPYFEPPLWVIDSGSGEWQLWNAYDANAVSSLATKTYRLITSIPQTPNKWEEFVIWMAPSWTSAGALKVWHDARMVFQESGQPNCYNHLPARGGSYNYIEYGVYGGKTTQLLDRAIYHKGHQTGDEAYTTFNQFMAACGSSITEKAYSFRGSLGRS